MKILIVHNRYQSHLVGGEDLVFERELKGLKVRLGAQNVMEYQVSNDHVSKLSLLKTIWHNAHHARSVQRIIQAHDIDLVHVHNFFPMLTPSIFQAAKAMGVKVVHSIHNYRWWCLSGTLFQNQKNCHKCVHQPLALWGIWHRCYRQSWLQSLMAALAFGWYRFRDYFQYVDTFFALSHHQLNMLQAMPIDSSKIVLKENPIEPYRVPYPLAQKKGMLFIGRLEAGKGIQVLLEAFEGIKDFDLWIIGKGPLEKQLKAKYSRSNIHFLGNCTHKDTVTWLSKVKYLVHPSLVYESFGLTLVEAMYQKTPVIGFNIGTRPEFIRPGCTGFLCDPKTLRSTLLKAYKAPDYAHMCAQAHIFARTFVLNRVIDKQIQLYRKLLNFPSGSSNEPSTQNIDCDRQLQ